MDGRQSDSASSPGLPKASWSSSDLMEKLQSLSLIQGGDHNHSVLSNSHHEVEELASWRASQTLWAIGRLSQPIPDGFYSILMDRRLKEHLDTIPSLEDLNNLYLEGLQVEVILVNADKDRKLSMLKQLILTLVKGLNSNTAAIIKKIAGLVCDFCKRPNPELSPVRSTAEDMSPVPKNGGVQLLGHIKHGTCHPRAILFKVLADTVGLDSEILMGLPENGPTDILDSYKHVSVSVVINSAEFLVDLIRFPGKLIPFSTKAFFTSHMNSAGESDSVENDSCDSPLEPNSPLWCRFSDKVGMDGSSHSDPNIANAFTRRKRWKTISAQQTANSSPDHPLFKAQRRSVLSGEKLQLVEPTNNVIVSRSAGSLRSEAHRRRRRHSISMVPEIGDDIVRLYLYLYATRGSHLRLENHSIMMSGGKSTLSDFQRAQYVSQRAMSLPSSPHKFGGPGYQINGSANMTLLWNKVLESSKILDKLLLPYQEWNIDFSELTVGTRVGIGFFGEVFRGTWNGTDVAIKVFLEQELTGEIIEDFCNEISILTRLRHPNVILFLGACTKPPRLSMVTEYMELGSLHYLIHASVSSSAGTPEWMAPELIRNEPFTESCDVFSLGVIIWELCTLKRPWDGVPPVQVVYAVANDGSRLEIPDGPLGKIISDCWAAPNDRPSCDKVLKRLLECEYTPPPC
uniref:non-specific serine/threonine protein kinase n=1 Tax=Kalanchoe fedtschenkoi TaxID=63787 RepID=A0A7N0TW33_KALFE